MGAGELERASPAFLAAVRWAVFVERYGANLMELRAAAKADVPDGTRGQALINFQANRKAAENAVAEIEAALYPPDEDDDAG